MMKFLLGVGVIVSSSVIYAKWMDSERVKNAAAADVDHALLRIEKMTHPTMADYEVAGKFFNCDRLREKDRNSYEKRYDAAFSKVVKSVPFWDSFK